MSARTASKRSQLQRTPIVLRRGRPAADEPCPKYIDRRDTITILVAVDGHTATKRFEASDSGVRKLDYNAGHRFGVMLRSVADIGGLSAILLGLERLACVFVVRGIPKNTADVSKAFRRKKENFATPALGHHWVLFDFDEVPLPPGLSLRRSVGDVCEYLIGLLPPEFQETSYHWQLSSSAGMGAADRVSMHLWFWLHEPTTDAALKQWGKAVNSAAGVKLIDTALFNDVQIHYTAAPIFRGIQDPFPVRSGLTLKKTHEVALLLPPPPRVQARATRTRGVADQSSGGFEAFLDRIGDHEGGGGFHEPIIQAAASYVATHGADDTDVDELFEIISAAVRAANAANHDAAYVAKMASREHIAPAVEGAIRKFGDIAAHGRKTRLHTGVAPHYTSKRLSVSEAQRRLDAIAKPGP